MPMLKLKLFKLKMIYKPITKDRRECKQIKETQRKAKEPPKKGKGPQGFRRQPKENKGPPQTKTQVP